MVSPLFYIVGMSATSIYGIDLENSSGFDEPELDDDFSVPAVKDLTVANLISSRFRSIRLASRTAFLPPDSPPPK